MPMHQVNSTDEVTHVGEDRHGGYRAMVVWMRKGEPLPDGADTSPKVFLHAALKLFA